MPQLPLFGRPQPVGLRITIESDPLNPETWLSLAVELKEVKYGWKSYSRIVWPGAANDDLPLALPNIARAYFYGSPREQVPYEVMQARKAALRAHRLALGARRS